MKVRAFNHESRSDAKNMMNIFEKKYKLDMYEVLRPMFDPKKYAKDVLKIRSVIKHVRVIEDYWADCKYEFEIHDHVFARWTVDMKRG